MPPEKFKPKDELVQDATVESTGVSSSAHIDSEPVPGRILLGLYEVVKKLGRGGMSDVFLCRHVALNQLAAIKILHLERATSDISLQRFNQEAKATFQLNHPNIIRMLDFRPDDSGMPCIVMEYLEGKPLDEILATSGTLDLDSFVQIFSQVCDGLDYAHDHGVVHRDLKPSNLMVNKKERDGKYEVKIVDFGIAKVVDMGQGQQLTRTGEIFGSPLYMSPEQCKGMKPDRRSDFYSLGCTMYESLTGVPPFRGDTPMQTLFMHAEKRVPPLRLKKSGSKESIAAVEFIIQKLLNKDPSQRFQHALDIKKALLQTLTANSGHGQNPLPKTAQKLFAPVIITGIAIVLFRLILAFVPTEPINHQSANHLVPEFAVTPQHENPKANTEINSTSAELTPQTELATRPIAEHSKIRRQIGEALKQDADLHNANRDSEGLLVLANAFQLSRGLPLHDPLRRLVLMTYSAEIFKSSDPNYRPMLKILLPQLENLLPDEPRLPKVEEANVYGWHGIIKFQDGDNQGALTSLESARRLSSGANFDTQTVQWMAWEGNCYARLNRLDKADAVYDRAEKLLGDKHPVDLCSLYSSRAVMYIGANQHKAAVRTLNRARTLAEAKLSPSSGSYKFLSRVLEDTNQPPSKKTEDK